MKKLVPNEAVKKRLKVIGYTALTIGMVALIVALVDFFSSSGTFEMPKYPWLFFIALPLIFVGAVCLGHAYMGNITRYQAAKLYLSHQIQYPIF